MVPVSLRIEATFLIMVHKALHRLVLITSLISTTLSFPSGYLLPQDLCTCCSLCLELFPRLPHSLLPHHFQVLPRCYLLHEGSLGSPG